MTQMKDRLREIRTRAGLSQGRFGAVLGVTREAVSQWEKGSSRPSQDKLEKIAKEHGVTLDWIAGMGPDVGKEWTPYKVASINSHIPMLAGRRDLPILGHAKGGDDAYFIDNGIVSGFAERPSVLDGVEGAYAVEFWDTSMEPVLKHGHLGWVHPLKSIKPGDDVVVQTKDGQAIVKTLVRRTESHVILRQYNPAKDFKLEREKIKAIHLIVGTLRVVT